MRVGTFKTPTGKLPLPGTTYGPLRWVVNAATWWHQKGWNWTWNYRISWWNRHLKHSVMFMMLVKWMFVVVDLICQLLCYTQYNLIAAFEIIIQSLVLNMSYVMYAYIEQCCIYMFCIYSFVPQKPQCLQHNRHNDTPKPWSLLV